MPKVKVAILGTGNIGSDLLSKVIRSEVLECGLFAGRDPDSIGIKRAREMGIPTSSESIASIEKDPGCCEIVFDATNANSHRAHAPILKRLNKFTIDLTPSQLGKMCIPVLNLSECLKESNVNVVTCGGQAITPIAFAIMKASHAKYMEVVSSISSKSAGLGTRDNIDEYTQTTKDAIAIFSSVKQSKAIIIINPADPPIIMHNTLYSLIDQPNMGKIKEEVMKMEKKMQEYVPGYKVTLGPIFENGRVTTMVEVIGLGDYLPKYAGNLDIINCAALKIAEEYAER